MNKQIAKTSESFNNDFEIAAIPGWKKMEQIWDDIAGEEFEVSSNYSMIDGYTANLLGVEDFDLE